MKLLKFMIGLCLSFIIILTPFSQFQAAPLAAVRNLSVQLDGRKKLLDTVARETVIQIYGRANYQTAEGDKLDYLQTYLSLWTNDRDWNQEPLILFNYRPLKTQLALDPEQKYFTFSQLMQSDLSSMIRVAQEKQAADLDLQREEREALTVAERLTLIMATVGSDRLPLISHPSDIKGKCLSIDEASRYYAESSLIPVRQDYSDFKQAYRNGNESETAQIASQLQTDLASLSPQVYPQLNILQREVKFYRYHFFAKAWMLYGLGFITMLAVLWFNPIDFYWGAVGIFSAGLMVHGYGFIERMQIAGRPPVTNMYESVIWVSFGIVAIALLFEFIYRAKYYLLAAAPLSILCLILADSLPAVLDPTISPLVPVLRDNFWLSVHVPTITLSYAGFALAYGLGHTLLAHYLFAPQAKTRIRSLSQWNYGVLQAGVLLLTTGIILGE